MKKVNRKVPQSVKVKRRIDAAIKEALTSGSRQHSRFQDESIHKKNLVETPQYFFTSLETQNYSGWIVQNWQRGWLWLSNWVFALIAWVAIYGIPPEMVALIPEASRETVIPALSALGVFCRFIDQNRKKPLPLAILKTEDK